MFFIILICHKSLSVIFTARIYKAGSLPSGLRRAFRIFDCSNSYRRSSQCPNDFTQPIHVILRRRPARAEADNLLPAGQGIHEAVIHGL